jgi:hypothetical protein
MRAIINYKSVIMTSFTTSDLPVFNKVDTRCVAGTLSLGNVNLLMKGVDSCDVFICLPGAL